MKPIPVITADGTAVASPCWFEEHEALGAEPLKIISVLGAQSSGKSTLLNLLFDTEFVVGQRSAVATATTKGIFASKTARDGSMVVLDVEGSDSRERGRNGRVFQEQCGSFATAISDVILLNLWYHDVGRFDAAGYNILRSVFSEGVRTAEADPFQCGLVFVVRDTDDDIDCETLKTVLMNDAKEVFRSVSRQVSLESLFEISVVTLQHMRHKEAEFSQGCEKLSESLLKGDSEGHIVKSEFSKGIPADGCGTFTKSLWESYFQDSKSVGNMGSEGGGEEGESLIEAYKCNEAFSDALMDASLKMSEFSKSTFEAGEKIEKFGKQAAEIMNNALSCYDDATEEYSEGSIRPRKRRELESIIDTSQHAIFMKQVQVLRENALAHFKSATASDDIPSDFAFYTADSLFQREAEESKRPGSSWNTNQERSDLQNMMQEISTQRKRLLTSQVSAAQQQAHAMQYLQMQQSQMNAIQAQAYGGSTGQWNVGAAYRPPDTNINASLSYQQGRTNIQISMVPDESASLLGPNGFTAGVGPGNLGLSFNIGL